MQRVVPSQRIITFMDEGRRDCFLQETLITYFHMEIEKMSRPVRNLLDILRWVQMLMPILSLPDWAKSEDVRLWVLDFLGVANAVADMTESQLDDNLVLGIKNVVANPETWTALYRLIFNLIGDDDADTDTVAENPEVVGFAEKLGNDTGIDPVTIIVWIMKIIEMIREWRNR